MNYKKQYYKEIQLRLIKRNYSNYKAKRYTLYDTNQNVWIPNSYLLDDGTIKQGVNIDFVFRGAGRKLELAKNQYDFVRRNL